MIDKNEAQDILDAIELTECEDCKFYENDCNEFYCDNEFRKDGHDVIFVKKEDRNEN